MILKNKKTNELVMFSEGIVDLRQIGCKNVAEMIEEGWEDYEEPKDDYVRVIESFINYIEEADDSFCCDETVQKFAEKLKAWKILNNNGFRIIDWELDFKSVADGKIWFDIGLNTQWNAEQLLEKKPEVKEALDLLFGGEK